MIPKIVHWIWIGGSIPEKFSGWMMDFRLMHPKWDSIVWDDLRLSAIGVNVRDLAGIFPANAGVSNAARLIVAQKFGGVYLDCDVQCLKPIDELCKHSAFAARQDHRFCNAVFGATPGHPWINWQVENMSGRAGQAAFWGPELMTDAPSDGVYEVPRILVYPFLWDEPDHSRKPHEESIMVHHWNKSWI